MSLETREVVVAEFGPGGPAEIAASLLRAEGLPFRFNADDIGGMVPGMRMANPIELVVPAGQMEHAIEVLGELALEQPRAVVDEGPNARVVLAIVGVAFFLIALMVVAARGS